MPGGLIQGLISPFIGRIFDAVGPRPLMIPGAAFMVVAMWGLALALSDATPLWLIVTCHVLFAVGVGMLMTPLMTTSLASLPGHLYGHGSAIMNTLQQLAGAAGTAILVVVLTRGTAAATANGHAIEYATARGAHWAFACAGVLSLVVLGLTPFIKRAGGAEAASESISSGNASSDSHNG